MHRNRSWLILASMIGGIQCSQPAASDDPEILSNLRFSPSAFDSFRRNTEIRFTLKHPVRLDIAIVRKDSAGREVMVKTLLGSTTETKGSHAVTWLGDTDAEVFAPAGLYIGIVKVDLRRFETTVQVFHF